ncbi:MAG: hypothetical protein U5L05_02160 [Rubrivivax sp.]|nr:hypothetical protein [Rubrivivax sp.]
MGSSARAALVILAPRVPELLAELEAGRMAILVDEEDRRSKGDLVPAANQGTSAATSRLAKWPLA